MENENQTGLYIPEQVLNSKRFSFEEKVILAEIITLGKGAGCTAPDAHFASKFHLSEARVAGILQNLNEKKAVQVGIKMPEGRCLSVIESVFKSEKA